MKHIALVLLLIAGLLQSQALRVVLLNVGQGQALMLQKDGHGILVDTGEPERGGHVIRRLKAHGVRRLDYLILTHLHSDHAGGYYHIRRHYPDAAILWNGLDLPDNADDRMKWIWKGFSKDKKKRVVAAGQSVEWKGATIGFLWPQKFIHKDPNHHSLVVLIRNGGSSVLVMGDAGKDVEKTLYQNAAVQQQVTLFVIGHHGAADAGDADFLQSIKPKISLVSLAYSKAGIYAVPETMQTLAETSNEVYRTDRHGEICRLVGPGTHQLQPCR